MVMSSFLDGLDGAAENAVASIEKMYVWMIPIITPSAEHVIHKLEHVAVLGVSKLLRQCERSECAPAACPGGSCICPNTSAAHSSILEPPSSSSSSWPHESVLPHLPTQRHPACRLPWRG